MAASFQGKVASTRAMDKLDLSLPYRAGIGTSQTTARRWYNSPSSEISKKYPESNRSSGSRLKDVAPQCKETIRRIEAVPVAGRGFGTEAEPCIADPAQARHGLERPEVSKAISLRVVTAAFDQRDQQVGDLLTSHLPVPIHLDDEAGLSGKGLLETGHHRGSDPQILGVRDEDNSLDRRTSRWRTMSWVRSGDASSTTMIDLTKDGIEARTVPISASTRYAGTTTATWRERKADSRADRSRA